MSNMSKPPARLVNEDLVEKPVTKKPVSKLTQLHEAPDLPEKKKSFLGGKPKLEAEKELPTPPAGSGTPSLGGSSNAAPPSKAELRKAARDEKAAEAARKKEEKAEALATRKAVKAKPAAAPVEELPQDVPTVMMEVVEEEVIYETSEYVEEAEEVVVVAESEEPTTDTGQARFIAHSPELDSTHLAEFAKSDNEVVRAAVAGNPSTSLKTLLALKKDKSDMVIQALIMNPNFPAAKLAVFLSQAKNNEDLLYAFAEREDLPPSLSKKLAKLIP